MRTKTDREVAYTQYMKAKEAAFATQWRLAYFHAINEKRAQWDAEFSDEAEDVEPAPYTLDDLVSDTKREDPKELEPGDDE